MKYFLEECAWLFRLLMVRTAEIRAFGGHDSLENTTYAMQLPRKRNCSDGAAPLVGAS